MECLGFGTSPAISGKSRLVRYYDFANFGQIYDKLVILDDFSRSCDRCKNAIHRVFF